jgi:hypothetical protein
MPWVSIFGVSEWLYHGNVYVINSSCSAIMFAVATDTTIYHRDKTRVLMAAKMFPHLKLLCWLFIGPYFGFDTQQRNSFLIKFGVFLQ